MQERLGKNSTRAAADRHEKSICKALGAKQQSNSGSGYFEKGDVICEEANLLIEAKCTMSPKQSFSIKKEWLVKNKKEALSMRKANQALCFRFDPEGDNYYIINESLMQYLIKCLSNDENI